MKALVLWFAVLLGIAIPARADEPASTPDPFEAAWAASQKAKDAGPAPEPDVFAKFDQQFGAFVVGPLATVMFFDVVMWDNRATMHYAVRDYDESMPRYLHRTTADGERPV